MSAHENGGPAFPVGFQHGESIAMKGGMTLRDYFAAKAMQAFICSPRATQDWIEKHAAQSAYYAADAMLKERAK